MSSADSTPPWLTLVGIGEDGYPGLGKQARRALLQASRIVGAARQLELLPPCIGAARETWPTPFSLEPLLARRGQPTCVLASGDPMLFGVGASLARQLPATELRVLPAPSSLSLAAARLGASRSFRGALRVEWLIVAILLLEAGLSLWELWNH